MNRFAVCGVRCYSTWQWADKLTGGLIKRLWNKKTPVSSEQPPVNPSLPHPPPTPVPLEEVEEKLKAIAHKRAPQEEWKSVAIAPDLNTKSRILRNCELMFTVNFPDSDLGRIHTMGDVFAALKRCREAKPRHTRSEVLRHVDTFPSNFTSRTVPPKPPRNKERIPFSNYDSPKHKTIRFKKKPRTLARARNTGHTQ